MNNSESGNFWDHMDVVECQFREECAKIAGLHKLEEFEMDWLDPKNGKIANLSKQPWFADAKYVARKIAQSSIRHAVQAEIGYYRLAATLLETNFG